MKFGPYRLMLPGVLLMGLTTVIRMGDFMYVMLAAGWVLVIAGVFRRRR